MATRLMNGTTSYLKSGLNHCPKSLSKFRSLGPCLNKVWSRPHLVGNSRSDRDIDIQTGQCKACVVPRLHRSSDPPELLVVQLIGRNVRGDGNPLQSRAHHREIRRRRDEHLHGKQGKGRGTTRDAVFSRLCSRRRHPGLVKPSAVA